MKSILYKIALIIWVSYIVFGILSCFAGVPGLGVFIMIPAVLGITLTYRKPQAKSVNSNAVARDIESHSSLSSEVVENPVHGVVTVSSASGKSQLTAPEYVVLDIETTGLSEETDMIIEVAALKINGDKVINSYESLVNPCRRIPAGITALTGISNEDVQNAPSIDTVLMKLNELWTDDIPVVAHNAPFDVKFIAKAYSKAGISREIKYIDTLSLSRKAFPGMKNYKMSTLALELKLLDCPQKHRALSDAEAAYRLYLCCRKALTDHARPKTPETVSPADICSTVNERNPLHSLYGKNLVFTGELSISRQDAMQMAVNAGAVVKSAVSGKTDYLVVGEQDVSLVGEDGLSGKEEKAYALNKSGKANIRIIREPEFLELINSTN